ncbi:hypothetical protein TWF173_004167 [Orbilia oligospora]|nr:hypothetical protein TWF173_004167 [Orbilia oligospora]
MPQLASITLTCLPTEIILQIVSYLGLEDIKTLSASSKSCRRLALSIMFQSLTIPSDILESKIRDKDKKEYEGLQLYHQMAESTRNKNGTLYLARMDVIHVTLTSQISKTIGEITRYFRACSEILANFHNLQTVRINLDFPEEILTPIPDFQDRLFNGLFTHLSIHCPKYTSIMGLSINIGIGVDILGKFPRADYFSRGIEDQENRQFLGLDSKSKLSPPYPPSLEIFDIKSKFSTTGHSYTSSFEFSTTLKGFLYSLSLIQCSGATLRTIDFDMNPWALEAIFWGRIWLHLPSNNITFPLVKSISLNIKSLPALQDSKSILPKLTAQFPNIEEVSISYERGPSRNIKDYHSYFENLAEIPGIRRLRTYWPISEFVVRSKYDLMGANELINLTRCFAVDYKLHHLEEVIFTHDDWAARHDSYRGRKRYKAIACRVNRDDYGWMEIKVGEEFREVGRFFDRCN